ncbi:MAG: tetratricopeptide repeat protein, partial [Burkholderiaceae bacterium]
MPTGDHASGDDAPVLIGQWRVDPRADEIEADGRVIKLEPLRMRLLMALARRPGEVVLANELLDTVWKGVIVTPGSLYQSVAQLRQLLGDSVTAPRYIETVPRKGYRLIAPVTRLPDPRAAVVVAPFRPTDDSALVDAPRAEAGAATPTAVEHTPGGRSPISRQRRGLLAGGAVAAVVVAVGGVLWWRSRPGPGPVRIAVLPFTDRSTARLDQPLANGVTQDVIRTLERHPALEVMTFDAVERLKEGPGVLGQAAQRLDVAFALVGDLRRVGDRVHITTQLVALPGEKLRQSATFDESIGQLSTLPQAIALKAVEALELKVVALVPKATLSSAYEMYVLGIDAVRAKTPESVERARRYFSQGIEIDPAYARNYSGLASSWIVQYEVGGGQLSRREAFARAEQLYGKALQLDPELVEAKLGVANVAREYQRFDEARRTYQAVIATHPNNIQARFGLGLTEEDDGWPSRAAEQYERAAALDPTHYLIPIRAGLALMYLGRLAEAEARFRRSIELDSTRPFGFYSLGILNWLRGRLDESVSAHREALKRNDKISYVWFDYAFTCTDLGLFDEARRGFERASQLLRSPNPASVDAAFVWLAEGALPPVPKVLTDSVSSPAPWERLLILTMAGDRPSLAEVTAVDNEQAGYVGPTNTLYEIVSGRFRSLDIASLYSAAGANDRAAPILIEVEHTLNDYEQRGVTAPAFAFHRARLFA